MSPRYGARGAPFLAAAPPANEHLPGPLEHNDRSSVDAAPAHGECETALTSQGPADAADREAFAFLEEAADTRQGAWRRRSAWRSRHVPPLRLLAQPRRLHTLLTVADLFAEPRRAHEPRSRGRASRPA
jgi:hypothetical protein